MPPVEIRPSVCPLDCPDRCALEVSVENDRIVKIDGSERSPFTAGYICAKVRRFDRRVESPDRVLRPMRRAGPKGSGRFAPISWDDAIAEIATRFRAIVDEHGAEAILPFSYSGSNGLLTAHGMDERFWNRLGASKLLRTFCAANTGAGWTSVFGDLSGSDPAEIEKSDAIVLWGVNPSVSGIHLVPLVRRAQERGAFVAVVDPRRTPLAKSADLHLPIYPGTDVVAALAMIDVCAKEGLADRAFVARHTRNFERLREAAADWPAERAASLARVQASALRELPRALARAKAPYFRVGWGLERNRNGTDAVRAALALRAILGRFGEPGAGVTISTSRGFKMSFEKSEGAELRRGTARSINMSEIGRALEETKSPPIAAIFVYDCNPLATAPNQTRLDRAMRRESLFTVVHEQVMTDTCALADLVLPATTFLEHRELCRSYGGYALQWGEPVVSARGEARPNHALFVSLAEAMGFTDPELRVSEEEIAAVTLSSMESPVPFERLRERRLEAIAAPRPFVDAFPSRGFADLAGSPGPPAFRPAPVDAELPLALISPASDKAISSTLFELAAEGSAELTLSPADAQARGLKPGDLARATNSFGEVEAIVAVSEELPTGVASMPKGLWRRATRNRRTATALAPDHVDSLGGGACYNDARVEVSRLLP